MKTKKILAILTAAVMMFTMGAVTVFAESSVVIANADAAYTVIIPACVNFGTITKTDITKQVDFNVTAEGLVDSVSTIKVTTTQSGTMYDQYQTATLPFTLLQEGGIFSFTAADLMGGSKTIHSNVQCEPKKDLKAAGSYKGIMTFTVTCETNMVKINADETNTYISKIESFPTAHFFSAERGDNVRIDIYFKTWNISELTSLQVSIYKTGSKLATCTLIDPSKQNTKTISCSFYNGTLTATGSWVLQQVDFATGATEVFDKVEVRAVKDNVPYVFTSTAMFAG